MLLRNITFLMDSKRTAGSWAAVLGQRRDWRELGGCGDHVESENNGIPQWHQTLSDYRGQLSRALRTDENGSCKRVDSDSEGQKRRKGAIF
jgi:hypothetical protein